MTEGKKRAREYAKEMGDYDGSNWYAPAFLAGWEARGEKDAALCERMFGSLAPFDCAKAIRALDSQKVDEE